MLRYIDVENAFIVSYRTLVYLGIRCCCQSIVIKIRYPQLCKLEWPLTVRSCPWRKLWHIQLVEFSDSISACHLINLFGNRELQHHMISYFLPIYYRNSLQRNNQNELFAPFLFRPTNGNWSSIPVMVMLNEPPNGTWCELKQQHPRHIHHLCPKLTIYTISWQSLKSKKMVQSIYFLSLPLFNKYIYIYQGFGNSRGPNCGA